MSRSWVYKLHFWPPYKHAAHYSGKTDKLPQRLADHALGRGARLTQVQVRAGGSWVVGLAEPGGTRREHQIKGHDAARYCNVCQALRSYQAGELDKEQALGRAGWQQATEHERGLLLDIFGIEPAEVDAEKVPPTPPFVPRPRPEPVPVTPEIDALVDELIAGWTADREIEAGA
jgi:predicted GIY-YIG superfamily endonuclease